MLAHLVTVWGGVALALLGRRRPAGLAVED